MEENIMTLDELATKHKCDKGSIGHNYTEYYAEIFESIKSNSLNFLEIGTWNGTSVNVWRNYFPNAKIHSWDINEEWVSRLKGLGMPKVFAKQVDQSNKQQLEDASKLDGPFDVVIDDGSHIGTHQILTFETLWPHVKPGGYYIVEDLNCSYNAKWAGTSITDNFIVYAKNIIDELNFHGRRQEGTSEKTAGWCNVSKRVDASKLQKELYSMTCRPGMIVLKKRGELCLE